MKDQHALQPVAMFCAEYKQLGKTRVQNALRHQSHKKTDDTPRFS